MFFASQADKTTAVECLPPHRRYTKILFCDKYRNSARVCRLGDYMDNVSESAAHHRLVMSLMAFMSNTGYQIIAADGVEGYSSPKVVGNKNKLGDGQDKQPDIIGYHSVSGRYANGEIKIGDDVMTDHSKTQFALFSTLYNVANNVPSILFIGIPATEKTSLDSTLQEIRGMADLSKIQIVTF